VEVCQDYAKKSIWCRILVSTLIDIAGFSVYAWAEANLVSPPANPEL
jgi:hypothetical protein